MSGTILREITQPIMLIITTVKQTSAMAENNSEKPRTNRRDVVKGLGMATLALPFVTGSAMATGASYDLDVHVEAGEGDWHKRDLIVDVFKAKVDVSDVDGSYVAIMVVPKGPPGTFLDHLLHEDVIQVSGSSVSTFIGNWNPTSVIGGLGNWTNGTYHLYATAVDTEGNIGGEVSDSFEIDT